MIYKPAPQIVASHWLNTPKSLSIADFRGRILVIEAFQMLCPGCVNFGLPQVKRISQVFSPEDISVIGLHTVFEHHEAQGSVEAIKAFAHEYKLDFPIALDKQNESGLPETMSAYKMQGTPTIAVIDRDGMLRFQGFGHVEDLLLGSVFGMLLAG